MEIVLSDAEMTMAANVGVMRRISSIKQKLKNIIKLTEYENGVSTFAEPLERWLSLRP